ncbi:MAG TPA: twin-arginine translocation signal domain-containing protein, partial [Vicinamibacterales bacterium]|nr:twin-arginine translocation signal domain-containing protein [Vicinamibacterales bacterium]
MTERSNSRRRFLKAGVGTAAGIMLPWPIGRAPAIIAAEGERPRAAQGLSFGDPSDGSIVVWSRSDRPARMLVDWSYDENFRNARRIRGPY